jgi:O-antigen/teichoic acid export membrane protein
MAGRWERLPLDRAANIAIRAVTMASRLAFIFVLAKFIDPGKVGEYGVFAASVSFSIMLIGWDFYTYSQREMFSLPRGRWSFVLQQQLAASVFLYLCFVPIQVGLAWFGFLPPHLIGWFAGLVVVEYLAQEVNRVLVSIHRPVFANLVLFVRTAAWVWCLIPVLHFSPLTRRVETVYLAWLVGAGVAAVMGGMCIWRDTRPWGNWLPDKAWIARGIKVGSLFLLSTLSFKALQTVDRYLVDYLVSPSLLGVYVVYAGLAMAVANVLDPAVYSFLYPKLVRSKRNGDLKTYRLLMQQMAVSAGVVSIGAGLCAALFMPILVSWLDRPIYGEHPMAFALMLVAAVASGLGMVPHYGLYAYGADRPIVYATASSVVVFLIVTLLTAVYSPFNAVPLGLLAAFTWMGLVKVLYYRSVASMREI